MQPNPRVPAHRIYNLFHLPGPSWEPSKCTRWMFLKVLYNQETQLKTDCYLVWLAGWRQKTSCGIQYWIWSVLSGGWVTFTSNTDVLPQFKKKKPKYFFFFWQSLECSVFDLYHLMYPSHLKPTPSFHSFKHSTSDSSSTQTASTIICHRHL